MEQSGGKDDCQDPTCLGRPIGFSLAAADILQIYYINRYCTMVYRTITFEYEIFCKELLVIILI